MDTNNVNNMPDDSKASPSTISSPNASHPTTFSSFVTPEAPACAESRSVTMTSLPSSVTCVHLNDKTVYLIGTAHVSQKSVQDVEDTITMIKPNSVCIELCSKRYQMLSNQDHWKSMDIFQIIRSKKATFFLAQLVMGSFYRRLGEQLGTKPGDEMMKGAACANQIGATLCLADRDVEITLRRVWGYLGFWTKMKLLTNVLMSIFSNEEIPQEMIEELKQKDQLDAAMQDLGKQYPEIKHRLIDERDIYLAEKIRQAPGEKVVAVIGAGHIEGICQHIHEEKDLNPLVELPPKTITGAMISWSIPILLCVFLIIGFFQGGLSNSVTSLGIWIVLTGSLSALGTLLALGHPLSIAVAFVSAPITTLHPLLAAGWFAGFVEAWVHKPTVQDFENLPQATSSLLGFWKNPVTKILLVIALSNVGSSLGMFISSAWIISRTL